MKNRKWLIALALLLCAAIGAVSTPSTVAYIVDRSNTLRNSFTLPADTAPQAAQVQVEVVKIVTSLGEESISPEGFRFTLLDTQTGIGRNMTTDAQGKASVTLTIDDPSRMYTYRLSEINDGRAQVTYSTESYDITITPAVDAYNCIAPRIAVNGAPMARISVTFENLYDPGMDLPVTGDHSHPLLWLSLLAISAAGLLCCGKDRIFRRLL